MMGRIGIRQPLWNSGACLFIDVLILDMSTLDEMKKVIDQGLSGIRKLMDEVDSELPKKIESFFESVSDGFGKFFIHWV